MATEIDISKRVWRADYRPKADIQGRRHTSWTNAESAAEAISLLGIVEDELIEAHEIDPKTGHRIGVK